MLAITTNCWGHSYGEIAGMSRSMHRSQGMGTRPQQRRQNVGILVEIELD